MRDEPLDMRDEPLDELEEADALDEGDEMKEHGMHVEGEDDDEVPADEVETE